jgi:hypothetical protein
MAKYILVKNKTELILGPIEWKQRFIQSELNDLGLSGQLPPVEVGHIVLDNGYELFPIASSNADDYNPIWQELVGPSFTYEEDCAHEVYTKRDRQLSFIKDTLKEQLAAERYRRETSGFTMNVRGQDVFISTAREDRQQFLDIIDTIGEGYAAWKFNTGFINVIKSDLESIVTARKNHIQTQFMWEKGVHESISIANTIEQLKAINIVNQE